MNFLLLTADAAETSGTGSMLLMIIIMFLIFWLMIIRPENKKKKAAEEMRSALTLGDEITTIGGIVGNIVQITENTITIETSEDRVRVQLKKWAISTTAKQEAAEAAQQQKPLFGRKKS